MKKIILFIFFHCAPKKIGIALCFTSCIVNFAFSQNPLVKMWDKRYGGTGDEVLYTMKETFDGGFILGGRTESNIGGDKTKPLKGGKDYWIVKVDSSGNKEWDQDFGGVSDDLLLSLQQTTDGGYILGGESYSDSGGDKTQRLWGGADFWILKLDSSGNKQWDKDYGGLGDEGVVSLSQTKDGGYILGGSSDSDSSGDKTQHNWGINDYWILKIDSLGNKQWDKSFGGTESDGFSFIDQTNDEGYILGGISSSGVSGDKTEPLYGSWPDYDYWIIKIDSLGNKEWDSDYGGTAQDYLWMIKQTNDHGFIISGNSESGISGDKTLVCWGGNGDVDYWILKIDSLGNKQWDKDYGGTNIDGGHIDINQTIDSGYLIHGLSYSGISGNKTENNLGYGNSWLIKVDSIGNLLWDKTILTTTLNADVGAFAFQVSEGCYITANCTDAGLGGDKSQDNQDPTHITRDFWIVKFCDSLFLPPNATAYADQTLCPGTCTIFFNTSFNALFYQWNFPGASPDTSTAINPTNICYANPGSYDVQLIASNANSSDTLLLTNYITVFPSPPPQSITQSGDTLFAIAGSASYQWYFNGNIINGATNYFYVADTSGDYNVVATDANGCEVEAAIFNVIANILQTEGSGLWTVYPNPVEDKCTIHNAKCTIGTALEISVFNVIGEKIYLIESAPCKAANCEPFTVDCRNLTPGLYSIQITTNKEIYRTKFIKR